MIVEGGDSMISSPATTGGNAGIVSRNNEMVGLRRVLVEVSLVEKGRERKRGKASLGTMKSRLEISVRQEKDRDQAVQLALVIMWELRLCWKLRACGSVSSSESWRSTWQGQSPGQEAPDYAHPATEGSQPGRTVIVRHLHP
ncbi:hypothetical protein SRHO_G00066030 [Serrasalmus rhombeus]